MFNSKKPFDRRVLEGVVVTAAMTITDRSNEKKQQIPERLKVLSIDTIRKRERWMEGW